MKTSSKILMTLSLLWLIVLLSLGGWWIYLMNHFDSLLSTLDHAKVTKMLFWEGSTFIILLTLICISLIIFYFRDHMKTKALQDFFASLTHELKTPLASIKLQGEVIGELIETKNDPQLKILLTRLTEDTIKLETQMDKILQLSRIERGGELNLTSVKLCPFIKNIHKFWSRDFELEVNCNHAACTIMADEFALELIFKNLFENTKNHSKSKSVKIEIQYSESECKLSYSDGGMFTGNQKQLATLFYKHQSSKGSGIGLYLIKILTLKMNGSFSILNDPNLIFKFIFSPSIEKEGKNA
jgi:signal transduction histidine kinase